jgi:hypothetical protein
MGAGRRERIRPRRTVLSGPPPSLPTCQIQPRPSYDQLPDGSESLLQRPPRSRPSRSVPPRSSLPLLRPALSSPQESAPRPESPRPVSPDVAPLSRELPSSRLLTRLLLSPKRSSAETADCVASQTPKVTANTPNIAKYGAKSRDPGNTNQHRKLPQIATVTSNSRPWLGRET